MQSAREMDSHCARLRNLRDEYENQERFMTRALNRLQAELDAWHDNMEPLDSQLHQELKNEQLEQAIELSHVRMALAGADEELAKHRAHRQQITSEDIEHEVFELIGA